jgi:hypothetical protein
MNGYFRTHDAEFTVAVQLNTGTEDMPVEDAQAKSHSIASSRT